MVPCWRCLVLLVLLLPLPFVWQREFLPQSRRRRAVWLSGELLALGAGVRLLAFFWYSHVSYQVAPVALASSLVEIAHTLHFRHTEFHKPKVVPALTVARPPNVVLIIGESLTAGHLGVLGYDRNTTPNLSIMARNRELVAFGNTTSIGVHTMVSVPYLLTGLQGSDPDGVVYGTPTVFDYAVARGYTTGFIRTRTRVGAISDNLWATAALRISCRASVQRGCFGAQRRRRHACAAKRRRAVSQGTTRSVPARCANGWKSLSVLGALPAENTRSSCPKANPIP